mmetsp:Transcript_55674/g.120272  ORF Transcript_55674/g.120272 Transcript_55674/m.120272 type:complete len:316 (+) Transcript_55674:16-963(+)
MPLFGNTTEDVLVAKFYNAYQTACFSLFQPHGGGTLLTEPKIYLGVAMWIFYWAWSFHTKVDHEPKPEYWHKAVLVFGVDLIGLSLFQHDGVLAFRVLTLINLSNCAFAVLLWHNAPYRYKGSFEVLSVYEDPRACLQVVYIFLGQTFLLLYVLQSTFNPSGDKLSANYGFWFAGYVAVQMGGLNGKGKMSALGQVWNIEKWRHVLMSQRPPRLGIKDESGIFQAEPRQMEQLELYLRCFLGFTVNTFYRDIIAFLTPLLLLSSADPMELVQNALAIAYVCTLDDLDPKMLVNENDDIAVVSNAAVGEYVPLEEP